MRPRPDTSGDGALRTDIPFRLRGREGKVSVEIGSNEDPGLWGYPVLGDALGFAPETARGFPVVSATVEYAGRGYDAVMAWIQLIRYNVEGTGEKDVLVDKPPQLSDDGSPYCYWGPAPSFFDAPSTPKSDMNWQAHAFLAASPDAVMTKVVHPLCGFSWGFETFGGLPKILPVRVVRPSTWSSARDVLQDRYPGWRFLGWADG